MNCLASESNQYTINACDAVTSQTTHINLSSLSNKRNETGGLHSVLKLAVGAKVMLTTNIDVSDGLVNGARGQVVQIVTNNNEVDIILVKFDCDQVGIHAIQTSPFRYSCPNAVPIRKHEVVFMAKGKRGSEITRLQFPLTLAWATTIHKVQGLTIDTIIVDMKGGHFSPGQAYVAFSRVKSLQGLHILNFDPSAIKKSDDVTIEMSRLKENRLSITPLLQYATLSNSHITIALLNIHSIKSKIIDLKNTQLLQYANVLCLCETWLSPSDQLPILLQNHIAFRADRQHNNKGGVLISVLNTMNPRVILKNTLNGIEILAVKLQMPE